MLKLWQQIKMYRNLLVVFWALNFTMVVSGLVVSWDYFSSPEQELSKLENDLLTNSKLQAMLLKLDKNKSEKVSYEINKSLEYFELGISDAPRPFSYADILKNRSMLIEHLSEMQQTSIARQINIRKSNRDKQAQLIWVGSLSILFGLFFPLMLIVGIAKLGLKAKNKTEEHVKLWISDWTKEKNKYDEPFKNTEFWARVLFLSVEHFAPHMNHPAADYVGKLSHEINQELHKSDEKKASTPVENQEQAA